MARPLLLAWHKKSFQPWIQKLSLKTNNLVGEAKSVTIIIQLDSNYRYLHLNMAVASCIFAYFSRIFKNNFFFSSILNVEKVGQMLAI